MDSTKAATLIAMCFEARNKAHIAHLQTKSFAQHKALNEFYDGIIGLADTFAESFQGRFGIISKYPSVTSNTDGIAMVIALRKWIDENRKDCGSFSEIQNEIDNIVNLCNSTIYKLQNLS